jgi:RNA polymerase sigma-70 factor (ECF subfamily)
MKAVPGAEKPGRPCRTSLRGVFRPPGDQRLVPKSGPRIAAEAGGAPGERLGAGAAAGARCGTAALLSQHEGKAGDRHPMAAEDEAVLARVRRGDSEAYGELVRRYQDKIYSIACGFVGPGDDALDVTQDVFVRAYSELGKFRGQSSFYTWLYRIAVNMGIDRVRKLKRERLATVDDAAIQALVPDLDDPARILETKELAQAVERAMERLSPKLRTVMMLHDAQGLSMHEVAQILGCRPATVRTRLFRARSQVRDRVRGREGW